LLQEKDILDPEVQRLIERIDESYFKKLRALIASFGDDLINN
jgi:hypothetical protein